MKYFRQFAIILILSFIGEILHALIPLPVPASIYGLVLMLTALLTGLVKLEHVKDASKFLIEIMPVMFIPAGVGLMNSWGVLKPVLAPVVIIMVVSTVIVMGVAGRVTQAIIRRKEKQNASIKKEKEV